MPTFSRRSLEKLDTCNSKLQEIAKEAIEIVDFSVLHGHRAKDQQNRLYKEGRSRLEWPLSKHNSWPSKAYDLAPWPINWKDEKRFFQLAVVILFLAQKNKVALRWGGAWKGRPNKEGEFNDLGHFELLD